MPAFCRTDLHVVDGELPSPKLPLVPGHEVIGRVAALGEGVEQFRIGDRVGVPWLGRACGVCGASGRSSRSPTSPAMTAPSSWLLRRRSRCEPKPCPTP